MESEQTEEDKIVSRNPATLEVNAEIDVTSKEGVESAVEKAHSSQKEWADRSLSERLRVLERFQELILERKDEIAKTVSRETGKPVEEAISVDIFPVIDAVEFLSDEGPDILEYDLSLKNLLLVGRKSKITREPLGVIGIITPWNYPFGIPGSQVVYALFAGNSVVLKPAEETTLTGLRLKELLEEAGLPPEVLQVVTGPGRPTGDALVNSDIDYMLFTGSADVGFSIRSQCAPRGIPTCLELGGSDPALVLEDANLDLTTDGIVWARFTNCGQTCSAVKRVYVVESIASKLMDEIVSKTRELRVGNTFESHVDVGPLISEEAVDRIDSMVQESVEMGATPLTGGERIDELDGSFYKPTILTDVTHEMPVIQEETFGPVLPIIEVEDEEEAIEMANDTPYGLTASVWTRDEKHGEKIARSLDAGTVSVNDHAYTYGINSTPWGGHNRSGERLTHGTWGLEELTTLKHIHVTKGDTFPKSTRTKNLWWFPYPHDQHEVMREGMEYLYGGGLRKKIRKTPYMIRKLLGKEGL
ncbi:MAG: aldehyde dehydrogenase family protein [Halobacteria archaeon]|nr:aldehyde dehydrogenase family protein [Halobacteria archaeon]